jgi:hypothetical protein
MMDCQFILTQINKYFYQYSTYKLINMDTIIELKVIVCGKNKFVQTNFFSTHTDTEHGLKTPL